jgi:hypothetical protein
MRTAAGLLLVAALLVGAAGTASPGPLETQIVRWSPFDSSGNLKSSLRVTRREGRCTDIGYTYVGGIGYRCGSGHFLFDACFRDGPNPTELVICAETPWDQSVVRLRSAGLLLYPGVTFTAPASYPWGIVLEDGTRCAVVQGAHSSLVARGKRWVVDYGCERSDVVLLREGIVRGRVWRVNAARYRGLSRGFEFVGPVRVRRVYFGALPPKLARQNVLANQAYNAALRILRRRAPKTHVLTWVRLSLPEADWAHVIFSPIENDRGYFIVLHRVGGRWKDASPYRPYCANLPERVRRQLFLAKKAPRPAAAELAPAGEPPRY